MKKNFVDCWLIDLLHLCFTNMIYVSRHFNKTVYLRDLSSIDLLHRCFINDKNFVDCWLIGEAD